ncbi:hypothetical protein [Shewanella algae]|uniref:hypothetical protein n=1 Tax=Shewanella algae TaxID=38313 RepID=UPI001AAE8C71|nr:hypothetical protein [Shewanella algae]MBO2663499.1 hypothetical protein [Shewanella algae]MCL1056162.1 hypothetical protein [Shewanella algae]
MSAQKQVCQICGSFRELTLHLHELGKFCELLGNEQTVFKLLKKEIVECGVAKTQSIAKWLRLASQLESVEMNTFRYEEAHFYCEPVADELNSNANHDSSLATQITRFLFISNALEEAYRLSSELYEQQFSKQKNAGKKTERQRSYSTQSAWLLDEVFVSKHLPEYYFHKVDGLTEVSKIYKDIFKVNFDIDLENNNQRSTGFALVRNIRNHIAHAVFPIVDNPEFTWEFDDPKTKKLVLTLLLRASRLAVMNIQVIIGFVCDEFKSDEYFYLSEDPDVGNEFLETCTLRYADNLHIEQEFGLNESSQWAWRLGVLEG